MSVVVSPGSNLPLPVGISEGQQFLSIHLLRFRSGVQADGLGGPINFAHEIPNRSPRNVFDDVPDIYQEFGLRRYRCYYLFNSHYTLTIPNIVAYLESSSVNPKSKISFAFGTSPFNGIEQTIPTQFHEPTGITWNSGKDRSSGTFLAEPLKPRNWKAFWVREILDFEADNTEFNFYVVRFQTANPVAVLGAPDYAMTFVGNMGCGLTFQGILGKMINRNPTAIFTLGNNSYTNTADCWLDRIASHRNRIHMAFGAWDWYISGLADKLDDSASPTIPKDWFWPEPESGCGDNRYQTEEGKDNQEIDPVVISQHTEPEDDPKGTKYWAVEVFDKDEDEEGNIILDRDGLEERWTFGDNEANARSFASWLKTCKVTEGEIDMSKFNLQLQNQYRNFFGMNNFDGYQSFYANNIMFLILNTNAVTRGHQEDSPQYRFAEEQLKRALDNAFIDYRIVLAYRPGYVAPNDSMRTVLFEDGSVGVGGLGYQGPIRSFNELYKPLFEKYKVTLYINGNVRNYQRTGILKFDSGNWIEPNEVSPTTGPDYKIKGRALDSDGIIYVTVGTGSGQFPLQINQSLPSWIKKSFIANGYLHMTSVANGQILQFRFYDHNDVLKDFFSIGREAFVFTPQPTPPTGGPPPTGGIIMNTQGIRLIYPKKSGGDEWDSRLWNNGTIRTVPGECGADPSDSRLKHRSNSGSVFTIDGAGIGKITSGGRAPVFGTWQNVESTLYIKCPASGMNFNICHLMPKTEHYCIGDQSELFGGYNLYIDYADKELYFKKEQTHEIGYTPRMASVSCPLVADRFQGFKCMCYNIPGTTNVKLEAYFDDNNGVNGGTWQKMTEWIDDGTEEIGGTAYPATTAAQGSIALRTDAEENGHLEYKWWHAHEIIPPGTAIPPPPGQPTPPPSQGQIFESGVRMFYPKKASANFSFSSGNTDRAQWVANLPHCFVNLEVTGYLKIDDVNETSEEVSIKLRGGRHSDDDPSEGSCYIIGIGYDGSVNSQYEEPHPSNHSMSFTTVTSRPLGSNIVGKWFGIKAIVKKEGSRDKIECWIDIGGLNASGQPANNWVKFWETTSDQFTGECNGGGEEKAYFRLDEIPGGDDEENVELRFSSCREIEI
jgi:hypothetical protein